MDKVDVRAVIGCLESNNVQASPLGDHPILRRVYYKILRGVPIILQSLQDVTTIAIITAFTEIRGVLNDDQKRSSLLPIASRPSKTLARFRGAFLYATLVRASVCVRVAGRITWEAGNKYVDANNLYRNACFQTKGLWL